MLSPGVLALCFASLVNWWTFAARDQTLELNAQTRAAGNRHADAVRLARSLLRAAGTPAQILHVRVDGVGGHEVAGVMLEGRPKHPLSKSAFLKQVAVLAQTALEGGSIEEADIWAVVPIPVPPGAVVSGPMAVPTAKTVYAGTFRRTERASVAAKVAQRRGIYIDPQWEATLVAEGPAWGAANPAGQPSLARKIWILGIVS